MLIVLPMLSGIGGIDTSLINLLNNISKDYKVDLCVLGNYINKKIKLPDNVRIIKGSKILEYAYLDYEKLKNDYSFTEKMSIYIVKSIKRLIKMHAIIRFISMFFKIKESYDCAISYSNDTYRFGSYMGGCEDVVLRCVSADKKIAWIHSDAAQLELTRENSYERYSKFDKIVNVSYACKNVFDSIFPEFADKSYVVYNMYDKENIEKLSMGESPYKNSDKKIFVTVARLDNHSKRIDKIIDCCHMLKKHGVKNIQWHIVGDGPDKQMLYDMAFEKDVLDILYFDGYKENPYPFIKNADMFIQTSDYEAHSMVLTEAFSLGTPVICTNYHSASEIVKNNQNGLLMGMDARDIYERIAFVLNNEDIIDTLKKNIKKSSISNENSLTQLSEVLN